MNDRLQQRLEELRAERGKGQELLRDLEAQTEEVRRQMLRIAGAIQVIEELLDAPEETSDGAG